MEQRQEKEHEELERQHKIEWELKAAKERIAKLEMEKEHEIDRQRLEAQ